MNAAMRMPDCNRHAAHMLLKLHSLGVEAAHSAGLQAPVGRIDPIVMALRQIKVQCNMHLYPASITTKAQQT